MKRWIVVPIALHGFAAALLVVAALAGCGGPQTGANGESPALRELAVARAGPDGDALKKARALCSNLDGSDRAECIERKRREEEAQQRLEKIRAECGADRHYDTTTPEGEREHARVAACMAQMQIEAMHEREAEQQAQEQRERLERARQQREAEAEQQAQEQHERLERARQQRLAEQAERDRRRLAEQAERDRRRKRRETAPCTEDNARQALIDDAADQHETEIEQAQEQDGKPTSAVFNTRPSDDQVRQQLRQCVETRIAPCQTKIDVDDLIGAAVCWRQVHDSVDEPDVNKPEQVQACFDDVVAAVQETTACLALPERTDDDILAKADCLTLRLRRARTCGPFTLAKYVERQFDAAKIHDEAARVEAKAKEPRNRINVRDSACKSFQVINFMEQQLDYERKVGRVSGYVDANKMHEIGSTIVILREQQRRALAEFQHAWKRSFNRARDCKKTH